DYLLRLTCLVNSFKIINIDYLNYSVISLTCITPFFTTLKGGISKLKGFHRIGPHNLDIISIIFGSLLGDAHGEKRSTSGGTRISFYQESTHVSYLLWLHSYLSFRGYCNIIIPAITTRLGVKGVVRQIIRFHTWTYSSFNWIYDLFYVNGIKMVPSNIAEYLTPLALAVWIMDDGTKASAGLRLCTNSFTYSDCLLLVKALNDNFSLKATVQSAGAPNQYCIYIWKESMPLLRSIVSPYIIPEMKYKIIE
ncbi:probable intron-encoded LAGLIDADG endonuclease, partial (mitochondrion) [Serendipita indica DSM 11827]